MREALALIRASWNTALSYRLSMLLSLVSLLVTVVPLYFVANALQPVSDDDVARREARLDDHVAPESLALGDGSLGNLVALADGQNIVAALVG